MAAELDPDTMMDFACHLLDVAACEIMPRFRAVSTELKPDGSHVTAADRAAETAITVAIQDRFPDHAVLGEEFGESGNPDARWRWVLDPLDGTTPFVLGLPGFGTLIGLERDGEPWLGAVRLPAIDETMVAASGAGCWSRRLRGKLERVTALEDCGLEEAFVTYSGLHGSAVRHQPPGLRTDRLIEEAARARAVTDCVQHMLVARGRTHVSLDPIMAPWDTAALVPCVEEAGGVCSDVFGERDGVVRSGSLLCAAGPRVHAEAVATLAAQGLRVRERLGA